MISVHYGMNCVVYKSVYCNIAKHISTIASSLYRMGNDTKYSFYMVYSQLLSESFTFTLAPDGDGVFLVNYYIFVCVSVDELRFCNLVD